MGYNYGYTWIESGYNGLKISQRITNLDGKSNEKEIRAEEDNMYYLKYVFLIPKHIQQNNQIEEHEMVLNKTE